MIPILLGLIAGFGLPVQTSMNTRLQKRVGTPYHASLVSFVVALLFLIILLLVSGQGFYIPFFGLTKEPFWIWTGGICGVIFLTGNILLFARLGGVQTIVLPVLGQILMGLVIDHFGLFFSAVTLVSAFRIVGAVLVVAGVLIVSLAKGVRESRLQKEIREMEEEVKAETEGKRENPAAGGRLRLWRVFGIFAGMLSAVQTAVNGYLGKVVVSPVKASAISFVIGIFVLEIICLMTRTGQRQKKGQEENKQKEKTQQQTHPWWMWLGGVLGGIYILANVFLSGQIGTGMTVIVLLIGATAGDLIVDHFALFEAKRNPVNLMKLLGVLIMVAGAAMIKMF